MAKTKKWIFPNPLCSRCRQPTYAVHTNSTNGWQYRRCRTPICPFSRKSIRVSGVAVPDPPKAKEPKLQCPYCEKTYQRQSALTKHIRNVHGEQTDDGRQRTDDGDTGTAGGGDAPTV